MILVLLTARDYAEGSVYLSDNPEDCRKIAAIILANNPAFIRAIHKTVDIPPGCPAALDWWKQQGKADGYRGTFCPILPNWATDTYTKYYNKGRIKALDQPTH